MLQVLAAILLIVIVLTVLLWRELFNRSQYIYVQSQKIRAAASQEVNYVTLEEVNELPKTGKKIFLFNA